LRQIPKCPPNRPDFMAPGPRVKIAESIELLLNERSHTYDDDDDNDGDGDDDRANNRPLIRHYRSENVLGQLYRSIDETSFLDDLQRLPRDDKSSLLGELWRFVKNETAGFIWDHHIDTGKDIQEM
jgi:hypothetical protein